MGRESGRAFSRQILLQYLLCLLGYCVALPVICFLGVIVVSSRTWYGTELIYPFLDWVRNYFMLLFIIALCAGVLVITIYFIRKPLRYVETLVAASQQLAREPNRPIELPELLAPVADRLNAARQELLRQNGLPPDWLEDRPDCPKCGDRGYIGSSMCECFERACREEEERRAAAGQ